MKKIIAFAAAPALALALTACGDSEVDDPAEADIADVDTTDNSAEVAGTYTGNTEDGGTWSSVLNADGTFEDTENGEVVRTGTWTDDEVDGTCFLTEGDTEAQCFALGEAAEDGTVEVTGPDGETFTMTKVS